MRLRRSTPPRSARFPQYDPGAALLVGSRTYQLTNAFLDAPGDVPEDLTSPARDALVHRLVRETSAPRDGWRVVASSDHSVTFGAPLNRREWWIDGFADRGGRWRLVDDELMDRRATPAQIGHGLELRWTDELVLHDGSWNDPLELDNHGGARWSWGGVLAAVPHLFDPATGDPVGPGDVDMSTTFAYLGYYAEHALEPGEEVEVPVALGASLDGLRPGDYEAVACVPELGLASSVRTLHVVDAASVPGVRLLTNTPVGYHEPDLTGWLKTANGCVAVGPRGPGMYAYLVLPQGWAFVERDGHRVVIDPIGEEKAALGDAIHMTGGANSPTEVVGGIPARCRGPAARYQFTPYVFRG